MKERLGSAGLAILFALCVVQALPARPDRGGDGDVSLVSVGDVAAAPGAEVLVLKHGVEQGRRGWWRSENYGVRLSLKRLATGATMWTVPVDTAVAVRVLDVTGDDKREVVVLELPGASEEVNDVSSGTSLNVRVLRGNDGSRLWSAELTHPMLSATPFCLPAEIVAGGVQDMVHPVGDVDGDGTKDVMVVVEIGERDGICALGVEGYGSMGHSTAWLVSGRSGALVERFASLTGGRLQPVGDLTGSGRPHLIEHGRDLLTARTMEGDLVWTVPSPGTGYIVQRELDGDPGIELIVCPGDRPDPEEPDRCGGTAVDGNDGSVIWDAAELNLGFVWLANDLNHDGVHDLYVAGCFAPCEKKFIRAVSGRDLGTFWRKSGDAYGCCEDLSGDGRDDIWAFRSSPADGSRSWYWTTALSGASGRTLWDSARHKTNWSEDLVFFSPAFGDVSGNRTDDLLRARHRRNDTIRIAVFEGSTSLRLWRTDLPAPGKGWFGSTRAARGHDGARYLVVDVYPTDQALAACRIHVLSGGTVRWSFPRC